MEWVFIGFQAGIGFIAALIAIVIVLRLAVLVMVLWEDYGGVILWVIGLSLTLTWAFFEKFKD